MPPRRPAPADTSRDSHGWRWALLGALVGGVLTLLLFAPAHWLAAALLAGTDGHLRLVNARGTVWNGEAGVVLASGAGGTDATALPGTMNWQLRPRWNGLSAALAFPCCTSQPLRLLARPGGGGMRLQWQDGQSRWPAALLAGLGAPWNTLRPEGQLQVSTQSFVLRLGRELALDGRVVVEATDIASSLSTLRPMGSYRVVVEGGSAPSLLLTTQPDSALLLSGSGRWTGRALRFGGEASAAPGREEALANLLNIIGQRQGARSLITLG